MNETDRLWGAWLDIADGKRGPRDLRGLLESNVRWEFKERALAVLLSPNLWGLPFRWDDKERNSPCYNYLGLGWLDVKVIHGDLRRVAASIVCRNADYVQKQTNKDFRRALSSYNKLILQFLAEFSEQDSLAMMLFEYYEINDPVPYMGEDDSSGYQPFLAILMDKDVPTKWKRLADQKMRHQINVELAGFKKPRETWEEALRCYAQHIQMANYQGNLAYGRELLTSQLTFIASIPQIDEYSLKLFDDPHLVFILGSLPDEPAFRSVKHTLARQAVLAADFRIYDGYCRRAAYYMLLEFGLEDPELAEKLKTLIAADNKRESEAKAERTEYKRKLDAVLDQMK